MSIQSLERRLNRLEAVAPIKSWDEWDFGQLERYSELLNKEFAALDGGEPLTIDEERERQAFLPRAPRSNVLAGMSIEQLEERLEVLDGEHRRLHDDPLSFI